MNIAVISFTESGRLISEKIAANTGAARYCFHTHCEGNAEPFTELSALISDIFTRYEAIVFVCAVGIAVRAVSRHIVSKTADPAVVAVDDSGRFAVSLLSGHLGGANALAERIADVIGAMPVITTATDAHGLFSPDVFAKANGLVICDMSAAKAVAAAVLDGQPVGLSCAYPHSVIPGELTECDSGDIGIRISDNAEDRPFSTTLNLLPRNLTAGIGCKKGTTCDGTAAHIAEVFGKNGLDLRRLAAVTTIDIKKNEPGLREYCEQFALPLLTFSASELMSAEGDFTHSDFVERTTGADNVCERAVTCAGARLTVRKTAGNGVTCAVGELPVFIDFERKD